MLLQINVACTLQLCSEATILFRLVSTAFALFAFIYRLLEPIRPTIIIITCLSLVTHRVAGIISLEGFSVSHVVPFSAAIKSAGPFHHSVFVISLCIKMRLPSTSFPLFVLK